MVEIVTQIRNAEDQADEIRRIARQEQRDIKDNAVKAGKSLIESEHQKATAKAAEIIASADAKAQDYLKDFAGKVSEECSGLSSQAQAKMEKAATFIVERIVERV